MLKKIAELLRKIKSFFIKEEYPGFQPIGYDLNYINNEKSILVMHMDISFPSIYRNISEDDLENFIQSKLKDIKRLGYSSMNLTELMEDKSWTDHEINMLLRYNRLKKNLFIVDYTVLPNWLNHYSKKRINSEMYNIIKKYLKTVNKKLPIYRYRKNYNWSVYEALVILKYLHIKTM